MRASRSTSARQARSDDASVRLWARSSAAMRSVIVLAGRGDVGGALQAVLHQRQDDRQEVLDAVGALVCHHVEALFAQLAQVRILDGADHPFRGARSIAEQRGPAASQRTVPSMMTRYSCGAWMRSTKVSRRPNRAASSGCSRSRSAASGNSPFFGVSPKRLQNTRASRAPCRWRCCS